MADDLKDTLEQDLESDEEKGEKKEGQEQPDEGAASNTAGREEPDTTSVDIGSQHGETDRPTEGRPQNGTANADKQKAP
jgi:hypothetical protein